MASEAAPATAEHGPDDAHGHDAHGHGDHSHAPGLQHQFDTPMQQFDTAKLGMWAFLAQELLFFGGLFVAYGVFRSWYPEAFSAGSHQLDRFMGGLNTVVLLFSSLTAALAVRSAQVNDKKRTGLLLLVTIGCAFIFLIVKYFEYAHKFESGLLPGRHFFPVWEHVHATHFPDHTSSFFSVYFMMTGLHGLHVVVGIGVLIWIFVRNQKGEFSNEYFTPVDVAALYWHLVDLIWIYLFPLLYLID